MIFIEQFDPTIVSVEKVGHLNVLSIYRYQEVREVMKKYVFCKLCLGLWFFSALFTSPVSAQELGFEVEWKVTDTDAKSCIRAITSGELFRHKNSADYYRSNGLIYRLRWEGSTQRFFCEEVELVQVSGKGTVDAQVSNEYQIDAESLFCGTNNLALLPITKPYLVTVAKEICKPTVNRISLVDLKQGLTGADRVRVNGFAYVGISTSASTTFFQFVPKFAMPGLSAGLLTNPLEALRSMSWNTFLYCEVYDGDEKAAELLQHFKGAKVGEVFTITGSFRGLKGTTLELEQCRLEKPVSG